MFIINLYVIRIDKRDELHKYLNDNGVGTLIHYPIPSHLQEAYQELGYKKGDFPIAELLADTSLSLPVWYGMTKTMVKDIAEATKSFFVNNL
jgi:dTDP-4-amino-4,6-dideoxygalactose transaminase